MKIKTTRTTNGHTFVNEWDSWENAQSYIGVPRAGQVYTIEVIKPSTAADKLNELDPGTPFRFSEDRQTRYLITNRQYVDMYGNKHDTSNFSAHAPEAIILTAN